MNDEQQPKKVSQGDWLVIAPSLLVAFIITFLSTLYPEESWRDVRPIIAWISFSWLVIVAIIAFVRKGRP